MPKRGKKRFVERYCVRFGKLAVEMGFITQDQLCRARKIQIKEDMSNNYYKLIGQILFELNWMTPKQIDQVLNRLFENKKAKEKDLIGSKRGSDPYHGCRGEPMKEGEKAEVCSATKVGKGPLPERNLSMMIGDSTEKSKVLLVDDEGVNRKLFGELIGMCGYEFQTAENGFEALKRAKTFHPDIILLDVKMPEVDGYEVCRRLKADLQTQGIPVVMITGLADRDSKLEGLRAGASDFLSKPLDQVELTVRMQNLLKVKKFHDFLQDYNQILEERVADGTKQLQDALQQLEQAHQRVKWAYIETVHRLAVASEYRDEDTGLHIKRMSCYSEVLARRLQLSEREVETISYASPMHDVGKIGIPDSILLKPGGLTPEEFEIMKMHTTIGAKILGGSESEFLRVAEVIALNHHERWDGTGYPRGLNGPAIPIEGQIVNIVDQYDALRSKRPYKPAFDHQMAYKILTEGDGETMSHHFNPDILQAFENCAMELKGIFETIQK